VGDIAGKNAVYADLNGGMFLAEDGQGGKQSVDGTFIYAEGKFAALEAFEVGKAFFYLVAEVDEALGVFLEDHAGVGHTHRPGATNEQGLAKTVFELADGEADGGLCAEEALGSAGKAAFFGDGEEDLQFA
jgi:hypothetical protein